jgi:phosphatidylinositol glycan class S
VSTSNSAGAASSNKQPPPETKESLRTRRWVILSFWVVVACLGLPVWWKTTAIYRAELPLQDMSNWADRKVPIPSLTPEYV